MSLLKFGFSRKKRFADCDGETEAATAKLSRCDGDAEKDNESKAGKWELEISC